MKLRNMNKRMKKGLSLAMVTTMVGSQVLVNTNTIYALSKNNTTNSDSITLNKIGEYKAGNANADGGVAEIVTYNKENNKMYTINGSEKNIHIVDMDVLEKNGSTQLNSATIVNVEDEIKKMDENFVYGDITSIDINYEKKIIAATVQHEDYTANGKILIMDYDGAVKEVFECGVQPDMVKISSDGKYILTADEGEPRQGYGENVVDPEGSVTILNYETGERKTVKFNDDQLEGKVLIRNKEGGAKVDLEPEYISLSSDEKTAYVALQENNAIATIDVESGTVKSVKSLGFKDHTVAGNELDGAKDGKINIENLPVLGAYMPDGITNMNIGGVEYILTANEGDATEWGTGDNEVKNVAKLSKLDLSKLNVKDDTYAGMSKEEATAKITEMAGAKGYKDLEVLTDVDNDALYTLGGRSFSIRRADTMEIVFDSGSDFESIIAQRLPEFFNVSNDKTEMDGRSTKKGPEPEYVEVGVIGEKIYAFVGIERQGGVMTYDITNPSKSKFVNYYNTRDYSSPIAGDSAPEGLKFISASDNPTRQNLLLVANEVSGTVSVNQIGELTDINLYHTNDIHSRAEEVTSNGDITNIGYSKFKSFINESNKEVDGSLLLDAGDTLHGQSFATLEQGESIAKVMKEVGYDALTPGNHDFNYGKDRLTQLGKIGGFDILAGNVKDSQGDLKYGSTMIKEIGNVKVGVFGLATPETAYKTNPNNVTGLEFGDKESIVQDAKKMVADLEKQGADIVVGLTHLGIDADSEVKSTDIAKSVDGIDIIIDGHSHSSINDYDKINNTIITSTGEHFKNFGMINVTYDKDSDSLIDIDAEMITAKDIQAQGIKDDTKVSSLIKEIKEGQDKILDTVIGQTPIKLDGERTSVRNGHTNLGRLLTNAMLNETNADIAMTNGGGIRASINTGNITKGNILDVLPFGNYIVTIEATGQQIIDALNHGLVAGAGSFTHFAGMDVKVKEVKDGDATRYQVVSVTVDGNPIDTNKKYTLATNDFLAVGGDNYTMLKDCKLLNEFSALDEALISYIVTEGDAAITKADTDSYLTIVKDEEKPEPPVENNKPVIAAEDKTINVGDVFDPRAGVTANDDEDGDLTDKIEITGEVDVNVAGVYEIVYSVTDTANQTTTLTIKVTVVEKELPPVEEGHPVINASNATIKVGEAFDPMAGVSASDDEDGDLTDKIEITGEVDVNVAGVYKLVYSVTNSKELTTTLERQVTVIEDEITPEPPVENTKPVISASDVTIKVGDTFDPLKGVSASDKEDGDITSSIKVVKNTVDTSAVGTYEVEYEVTDSQGETTTKTITVIVEKKEETVTPEENEKPVISANDITIKVGDTFDPLKGVSASDKEDGDITSSIKVVKNTVNTSVAGTYEVEYEVTDSKGETTTKTIKVTVEKVTTSGSGTGSGTGNNSGSGTTTNPSTGDTGIAGYIALAGASLGSILFASRRKRK